jgi:hypothetical protein
MKTKLFFSILVLTLSLTVNAQFPNFIKIDTGAITQLWGGHVSSACFDMDNDGDLDLFVCNSAVYANRIFSIFKNERKGLYIEMPKFIGNLDYKMLSSFGDVDNDGDIDFFAGLPGYNLRLYSNNGYGDFQFHSLLYSANTKLYPSLIDLNNDGFLDMVGINTYGGVNYNNGNGGFAEYESLGQLHEAAYVFMHGMSWGDCDDDGDMDVYGGYSSDGPEGGNVSKNACFLNNGDGNFVKFDPASVIVDDSTSENTSVNWVDYDNDGDMDLYVLNFTGDSINGPLNALYENLGNMQFIKHIFEDEMYRNSFKVSSLWGDLDNDADLDLYVTIENNVFPWSLGSTSATPYNLLYINDGNGGFTNILDHTLAKEDSHTALLFDHDNDGDLDVLLTRYSWSNDGYNNLFVNEGNDNSWMVLTCEGTTSSRTAIGTRVQAKCFVNGKHITQTREITPINGHLSFANLRVHFGFGDTDVIDTLIIRWPSGYIDEYLGVQTNQFFRAIEDSALVIDFKATNYIQLSPRIANLDLESTGHSTTIDLNEHYHFMKGDTVPSIIGDTLMFSIFNNDNSDIVQATLDGSILTLEALSNTGESEIQIIASAGFTERMDVFNVYIGQSSVPSIDMVKDLLIYPNPARQELNISAEGYTIDDVSIYTLTGQKVLMIRPKGETIDISTLHTGMYIIEAMIDGRMVRRKLLVE